MRSLTLAALVAASSALALSAQAITITPTTNANTLTNSIVGPGITVVGAPVFVGVAGQGATFSGGANPVGFPSGIILHTGNVADIPGPNGNGGETLGSGSTSGEDLDVQLGQPGDADIDAITGATSFDAASLSFSFQFGDGSVGGDLFFNFVFASEEYINFVGSQFNDAFALLIDGVNVARCNGSTVTINNVNPTSNASCYRNNVTNTNGFPVLGLNTSFDGLTTVLQASVLGLAPGVHTAKFVVADVEDERLDSAVFIQAGTFRPDPTPIPAPAALALFGLGLGALALRRR
jgi:hypothetical protein